MSDPRPTADQTDKLLLTEMRRRGFFDEPAPAEGPDADDDHLAWAEDILRHHGTTSEPHGFALVHAVLYLAEQQRIANLIKYAWSWPLAHPEIRDDIEKALGIS